MVTLSRRDFDAVVFDMDGVITDTAGAHAAAWKRTLDEFLAGWSKTHSADQAPFTEDDYFAYVDGKHRDDGVASFLESRHIDVPRGSSTDGPECQSVWGIANRKNVAFQRTLTESGVRPFATSVALVRKLQDQGIGTAVISASRNCQQVLESAGIGDLFAVRVDGLDTERLGLPGKPSPAIFLEAARRCGARPERAVVVEDAIAGVQAASAGEFALVIGVDRTGHAAELHDKGADAVVDDLGEIRVEDDDAPIPEWAIDVCGFDENKLRVNASVFALSDGRFGTSGAPLPSRTGSHRWVLARDVYVLDGPETRLMTAPAAMHLPYELAPQPEIHRVLDMRTGVLHEDVETTAGRVSSARFSSLAHPGIVAFRAICPTEPAVSETLLPPADDPPLDSGREQDVTWMRVAADSEGVAVAAVDVRSSSARQLTRIATYVSSSDHVPSVTEALEAVGRAQQSGFESLLAEHRQAWVRRWADADIVVEGDPELQRAIRYSLFHLMSSVSDDREAAVGARGLTGTGYRGHVFWDADVFVLPFLAATHPAAARAMLEYRIRRLPAARARAQEFGRGGARFPWESARSGQDVTPTSARDRSGNVVAIRTGQLEEHIVADVAWAAKCYVDWTGDEEFAHGPGLELLTETARYWASRVRMEAGVGHIYGVIGPDEYHEPVDDNAYTNIMARWNLRSAADAIDSCGGDANEAQRWRDIADALVDGYDPDSGVYEQFAGFNELEPLIIEDVAPRRPIAADLWLGAERVSGAQVIKQADVLMLHHLVPDAVEAESFEPNLHFYEPRTAHGSSLSPGVHASLFARARDYGHALEALRIASRIDLDDLTDSTATGLHTATMGALWQALAYGFAGVRPRGGRLAVDPRLPHSWAALELCIRFRGARVCVRVEHGRLFISADRPTPLSIDGSDYMTHWAGIDFERQGRHWKVIA